MTIAKWCVLVACLLPILTAALPKIYSARFSRKNGRYDNASPRDWATNLTGCQGRANAAQMNGFEALPLFMAAVIIAHQLGAHQARVDILAFMFVVLRILYIMMYVSDMATARSAVWATALLVNIGILFIGYR